MKIKSYFIMTCLLSLIGISSAFAASLRSGLEFSGNIDTVTGWQHDDGAATDPTGSCAFGVGGLGCNSADTAGSGSGQLGDFRGLAAPNRDTFDFYLDQVEIDIQKSFGDNLRIRADLDFGRFLSGTQRTTQIDNNFDLEQGYLTTNIPVGNGIEFLIGRFNVPIGLESVDRISNFAVSFSNLYRYVRPHNATGGKFYYPFSDRFDWNLYVVNNLLDVISTSVGTDSAIPSWGTRFGINWGGPDQQSMIGISYAGGPEQFGNNAHLTHIIDVDFSFQINKLFQISGEGIYRQDNVTPAFAGQPNSKALGGILLLGFIPSNSWNAYFRYDYLHDIDPTGAYTGLDQQIHDFSIGGGYQITDGAKIKFEYRLDLHQYSNAVAVAQTGGDEISLSNGLAAEFGYNF